MNILFRSLQQEKLSKEISVSSNLVNKRDFLGEGNKRSNTLAVNLVGFSEARTSIVVERKRVLCNSSVCVCVCVCVIWPIINSLHPVLRLFDLKKAFRKRQYLLTWNRTFFPQNVHFCLRFFWRLTKGLILFFKCIC